MKLFTTPSKELPLSCPAPAIPIPEVFVQFTQNLVVKVGVVLSIVGFCALALTKAKLEEDIRASPIIKVAIFLIIFL